MGLIRIVIMGSILLVAVVVHSIYLKVTIEDPSLIRLLQSTKEKINQDQLAESANHLEEIRTRWQQKKPWLRINVPVAILSDISAEIAVLETAINRGDIETANLQISRLMELWQDLQLFK